MRYLLSSGVLEEDEIQHLLAFDLKGREHLENDLVFKYFYISIHASFCIVYNVTVNSSEVYTLIGFACIFKSLKLIRTYCAGSLI